MLQSLYSGISGLQAFQRDLAVVGNNIANVNTDGFKASTANFEDTFSQTLRGATSPTSQNGGSNPIQVGLGTHVGSIDRNTTQGNLQTTGISTNMAVSGNGYFVVSQGGTHLYTRAGDFSFDANGDLVNPSGAMVLGWMPQNGTMPVTDATNLTPISIPVGQAVPAVASTTATVSGNLSANDAAGATYPVGINVYDSLGQQIPVTVTFTKSGAGNWSWSYSYTDTTGAAIGPTAGSPALTFGPSGTLTTSPASGTLNITPGGGASNMTVKVDFSGLTGFAAPDSAQTTQVDGTSSGTLQSYKVDKTGTITGVFSNGQKKVLAQVALAKFNNPGGLAASGSTLFQSSNNSGLAQVGTAGSGGRGAIAPGSLEQSNVDLAQAFTDMMVAQKAFQANAQVIRTSNSVLQTLVTAVQ